MKSYRIRRRYEHGVAKVWKALTTSELLERWLMPNDFVPAVGHVFTLRTDPGPGFDGIVHCCVLELEPEQRMVWSWKGGPIDTQIAFEVQGDTTHTVLTVVHTGFKGFRAGIVGRFLNLGSRKIYGKYLPRTLQEMDGNTTGPKEPESIDPECMGPRQRFLRGLLKRNSRKS